MPDTYTDILRRVADNLDIMAMNMETDDQQVGPLLATAKAIRTAVADVEAENDPDFAEWNRPPDTLEAFNLGRSALRKGQPWVLCIEGETIANWTARPSEPAPRPHAGAAAVPCAHAHHHEPW